MGELESQLWRAGSPDRDDRNVMFLNPIADELHDDIEGRQAAAAAGLRALVGPDV